MRPVRVVSLVLAAVTVVALVQMPAFPVSAAPRTMVNGLDVSMWQGTIDGAKVGSTDIRFAIMRATRGVGYVAPSFTGNQAGATANRIVVGAYHLAPPAPPAGAGRAEGAPFMGGGG